MKITCIEVIDMEAIHLCVDSNHPGALKVSINGNPEYGTFDVRNLIYTPHIDHLITFLLMSGGQVLSQRSILLLPVEKMQQGYQAVTMDQWQQLKRF